MLNTLVKTELSNTTRKDVVHLFEDFDSSPVQYVLVLFEKTFP